MCGWRGFSSFLQPVGVPGVRLIGEEVVPVVRDVEGVGSSSSTCRVIDRKGHASRELGRQRGMEVERKGVGHGTRYAFCLLCVFPSSLVGCWESGGFEC